MAIPSPDISLGALPVATANSDLSRAKGLAVMRRAPIAILGVPFDNVTTAEAIALIEQMVASGQPHYLVTANVDFLVQSVQDVELRKILFEAHLVLCDGTPLVWASRWLGNPLPERVAGSDLVPLLIQIAARRGYRLFFLGGSPEATIDAVRKLQVQFPELIVAGHYSPPFSQLLDMDHDEIRRRIQAARPDLLLVSFGCPKQEKWIAMHYRTLGVPVAIGVGGTIDFLAGRLARAPLWMQRTGTEWMFRLAQEPRRLFKRYAKDCCLFGSLFARQWWQFGFRWGSKITPVPCAIVQRSGQVQEVSVPESLDAHAVDSDRFFWESVAQSTGDILLNLGQVRFIDSTGMGLLVRLRKAARARERQLVLVDPSPAVRRALKAMWLWPFFLCASNSTDAHQILTERAGIAPAVLREDPAAARQSLEWQGEITAANAPTVWELTQKYLEAVSGAAKNVQVQMSTVHFLDSTGLGLMVRAKKLAQQRGVELGFTGVHTNVRNVIRLARLETYLLG